MIGMRLFKSANCPSTWLAHVSFNLFGLLALVASLAAELADRYVTRRETPKGWLSIESVILEHSAQSTTSPCSTKSKTDAALRGD
jgi:hypothetical protein